MRGRHELDDLRGSGIYTVVGATGHRRFSVFTSDRPFKFQIRVMITDGDDRKSRVMKMTGIVQTRALVSHWLLYSRFRKF